MTAPTPHLDWPQLVGYWLGDGDAAATEAIDEHLMQCDDCGARLDEVVALSRGVRDAFAGGRVASILSAPFVDALKAAGHRIREYRVPPDGSVNCAVGPDDELLVSRIGVPGAALAGVERLDALFALSLGHQERLSDIPFDAAAGEVVFAPRLETVRTLPSHDLVVRLLAVGAAGEREIGRYTFHHQA